MTDAPRSGILSRVEAASRRLGRSLQRRYDRARLKHQIATLQPRRRRALVVIAGIGPGGLNGPGKVDAAAFFPPFCASLAGGEIGTVLATGLSGLRSAVEIGEPTIIINVYREVGHRIDVPAVLDLEGRANGVFNRSTTGPLIADKHRTNLFLTGRGVAMPSLTPCGKVFSNSRNDTGAPVSILDSLEQADAARYNTDFIDTRVAFGGRTYHTCVRLLCVGAKIVHAYVRARDVAEGSPSVHAADTPVDPALIESLQRGLVDERRPELVELAGRIAAALGPGFYAHDVLLDRDGRPPLLCETGFKFQDGGYQRRFLPVAGQLPSHRILFSVPALAETSARLFVDESVRLGFL